MYHDNPRPTPAQQLVRLLGIACLFLLALAIFTQVSIAARTDMDAQAAVTLRQSVLNAAVQCYAVEGAYPESLERLEQDYGLRINRNKFVVTYTVFGSNVLPEIAVLQKQ